MTHDSFKTQFLHFDSGSATYITDVNNSTSIINNPYKAQYFLNQGFSNIKRVYLKAVEIPIGFSNIRTGSTDTLKFILNNIPYIVVLPEKNYTSLAYLLSDLTTACASKVSSGVVMTFGLTGLGRSQITFSGNTATSSFQITDTNLSKAMLGFRNTKDILVSNIYAASSANYNLNPDNYIHMYIPTLNGMNSCMTGQQATFKIPLNTIFNQVYFYQENQSFKQFVDITDKSLRLSNLTVIIYDKYGNNLNPNGQDFSFTLALEYYV